jgi:succinate dehydrogenase / fumarate reductase, cytochrome b subunit
VEGTSSGAKTPHSPSFVSRHQFLIYRLFSLAGLVPVGGYLVVHLLTNATILNGPGAFQSQVDRIHSLGVVLPLVEWTFIFLPLIFHAVVGWFIVSGAVPNTNSYPYAGNIRYVLQRVTGMIAFFFILYHVLQLHHLGATFGLGKFKPEQAASSAAEAIDSAPWIKVAYAIGLLSCVFHFANGIWTAGITWGVWTSKNAQRRANYAVSVFGVALGIVGLSALVGMTRVNLNEAKQVEARMEHARQMLEGQTAGALPQSNFDNEKSTMSRAPAAVEGEEPSE